MAPVQTAAGIWGVNLSFLLSNKIIEKKIFLEGMKTEGPWSWECRRQSGQRAPTLHTAQAEREQSLKTSRRECDLSARQRARLESVGEVGREECPGSGHRLADVKKPEKGAGGCRAGWDLEVEQAVRPERAGGAWAGSRQWGCDPTGTEDERAPASERPELKGHKAEHALARGLPPNFKSYLYVTSSGQPP